MNLPWPAANYSTELQTPPDAPACIVLRTANKKYYKKIEIPDLERIPRSSRPTLRKADLEQFYNPQAQSLFIRFRKPPQVIAFEQEAKRTRQSASFVKQSSALPLPFPVPAAEGTAAKTSSDAAAPAAEATPECNAQ
jgi:hypothetical protein